MHTQLNAHSGFQAEDLPTDEDVNLACSRSDEEFLLFQTMDAEFDKQAHKRGFKERLMTQEEIPNWVLEDVKGQEVKVHSTFTKRLMITSTWSSRWKDSLTIH